MDSPRELTAEQWFDAAVYCYAVGHQACPWCRSRHSVFQSSRDGQLSYYCHCCDFFVCQEVGGCHLVPGQAVEQQTVAADTVVDAVMFV